MKEEKTTIEAIHNLMPEMREAQQKIKTLREAQKDVMEQNDEYKAIADQIKELAGKRLEAKKALMDDKDYQKVTADLDDYRIKLKDLQEILSHYLVSYYRETNETKVVDDMGETRQVVLSAKIGKPEAK
jgi:uncharacterized coiled-coil DUF342 family protein